MILSGIEDEAPVRAAVESELAAQGWTVVPASTVLAAMDFATGGVDPSDVAALRALGAQLGARVVSVVARPSAAAELSVMILAVDAGSEQRRFIAATAQTLVPSIVATLRELGAPVDAAATADAEAAPVATPPSPQVIAVTRAPSVAPRAVPERRIVGYEGGVKVGLIVAGSLIFALPYLATGIVGVVNCDGAPGCTPGTTEMAWIPFVGGWLATIHDGDLDPYWVYELGVGLGIVSNALQVAGVVMLIVGAATSGSRPVYAHQPSVPAFQVGLTPLEGGGVLTAAGTF